MLAQKGALSCHPFRTVSQTATDIIWQTFPRCPLNNTLIVRDALTALTNVSAARRLLLA